jgi:ABC-type glycerol-3-phosphate transport system substrate-binding protein
LSDLGPLLGKEAWFKKDEFWSNILQTGQIAGVQLAIPIQASVEVLFYEKTVLQKHGVSDVPLDWTWDQLIPIAKTLTTGGKWGLRVSPFSPNIFSLAWQLGSSVVGTDGKMHLTEPGTIRALEFLDRLVHTEKIGPPFNAAEVGLALNDPFGPWWERAAAADSDAPDDHIGALAHGTVAMLATQTTPLGTSDPGSPIWWRVWQGYHVELTAVPRGDQAAVLGNATALLGIPAKPRNLDRSLAALEGLLDASSLAAFLPPRKTAPSLRQVSSLVTETDVKVLTASLQVARFLPGDVTSAILQRITQEMVTPILAGKKKPQDAANDAQKVIDGEMAW